MARSPLLAASLDANHMNLPCLFAAMHGSELTDRSIGIVEDILHIPQHTPHLDLYTVPNLTELGVNVTPFQISSVCSPLVSTVDERNERPPSSTSTCPAAVAAAAALDSLESGATLPAPHDAATRGCLSQNNLRTQLETHNYPIRTPRTYLDRLGTCTRERNVAAVLAVPDFLLCVVKLLAIPPSSREGIATIERSLGYPSGAPVHLGDKDDGDGLHDPDGFDGPLDDPIADADSDMESENEFLAVAAELNSRAAPTHFLIDTLFGHSTGCFLRGKVMLAIFHRFTMIREADDSIVDADTWEQFDAPLPTLRRTGRRQAFRPPANETHHADSLYPSAR